MLGEKRQLQGILIAALFFLAMLGSFVPDPFRVLSNTEDGPSLGKTKIATISDYLRVNTRYVALAPLLRGIIGYKLGSSLSPKVYIGRNDHLYYADEQAAAQSAGAIYRRLEVLHFVEMAAVLQRTLSRRDVKLVVAIPPNAQSIAVEDLPWSSNKQWPLEYDLALTELHKRGAKVVDLKAALLALNDGNAVYRKTDTHWNTLGSVLSFNLVVADAEHPEWRVDTDAVVGPVSPARGGDLARFMGMQNYWSDSAPSFILPPDTDWEKVNILRTLPYGGWAYSYAYERRRSLAKARVLMLGNSFTKDYWLPLFQHAKIDRIGWMHHGQCTFDFNALEQFEPTLVILAVTERLLPCSLSAWPSGLERPEATSATPD